MALSQKLTDAFNQHAGKIVSAPEFALEFLIALDRAMTPSDRKACLDEHVALNEAVREEFNKKEVYDELPLVMADRSHGIYRSSEMIEALGSKSFWAVDLQKFLLDKAASKTTNPMNSKIENAYIEAIAKTHDYRADVKAGKLTLRRHYKRFKK